MERKDDDGSTVKVRLPYRIIGLSISGMCIFVFWRIFVLDWKPGGHEFDQAQKIYFFIGSLLFIFLLLPSCILGKVPNFYLRFLRKDEITFINNMEKIFLEFSWRSIAFILMLALIASLGIYINEF